MDWTEELIVAGSAAGTIKLWDLEHAKGYINDIHELVVRTLSSHKASISSLEFHPFGEFFASGSTDKSIRVWDIRRKGCIQTYIGHLDQINVMKISPDGKWLASGGNDGLVKVIMQTGLQSDLGHDCRKVTPYIFSERNVGFCS
jgi:katanin p80 WD40 repeat-containing subunit B1